MEHLKSNPAYIYTNGALNRKFANVHPHEISLGHNLHKNPPIDSYNPNAITSLFFNFPYVGNVPTPLIVPENADPALLNFFEDPALQLIEDKIEWSKKRQKFAHIWKKDKVLAKTCSLKTRSPMCPKFVVDFAELNTADPDKSFNSTYNWYYTDGTLDVIEDNGLNVLLHPSMIESQINITPIQKCSIGYEYHSIMKPSIMKLKNTEPIYQISSWKSPENIIIGARQKQSFSLFKLVPDDTNYTIHYMNNIIQTDNFTNSCFDCDTNKTFSLSDVCDNVNVYDLCTMRELMTINLDTDSCSLDKWLSIKYYDNNILFAINRNTIHVLDIRTPKYEITSYKPEYNKDNCDEMSVFKFSTLQNNLLYVASSHNVFSYDTRMFKEIQPLQRWTHGMMSTPHLMNLAVHDCDEIISLASPLSDEVRVMVNTHIGKKKNKEELSDEILVQSFHIPWKPPTLQSSLLKCQSQGKMLKPNNFLSKRIKSCNSGLTTISNKDAIFMFRQNTFGDIFQQEIRPNLKPFEDDHLQKSLINWSMIESKQKPALFATNIINMKPVFTLLKSNVQNIPETRNKQQEKWKRPINELNEYKDILAEDLLAPWNLISTQSELPSQLDDDEATTKEKVAAWLEKSSITDSNPSKLFEHDNDNNAVSNQFFSQPVISDNYIEPLIISSSQPITKAKKIITKKRKYEGF